MNKSRYDESQQKKAVTDYLKGISVVQIAREMGVARGTIYTWIRKHKANSLTRAVPTQKEQFNLKQKLVKLQDIISVLNWLIVQ